MGAICYSERILNPFRGVMNVIALPDADAVTIDGVNWELYVHDCFHNCRDEPDEFTRIYMPDIRFGNWNRKTGLERAPLIASYFYDEIQIIGALLLEAVREFADKVPFEFKDDYELWLLDQERREPLALLDSVCFKYDIHTPISLKWRAGIRCREHFRSQIAPEDADKTPADLLDQLVNNRAGDRPSAQWFKRGDNGYGYGMKGINLDERLIGRELSPRLFPRLFIEQSWDNEPATKLVDDFIDWLSPWILLLDFLKDPQREAFEAAARKHAMIVDRMHPLYPKVVCDKHINAARVEAMLRKSVTDPSD
jgi:hypothetical protein